MISKVTVALKLLLKFFYAWRFFPLFKVWKKLDKNSENVVVIWPNFRRKILQYFYSDSMATDLALIKAVAESHDDLRIQWGLRNMRSIIGCNVFFNFSYRFNLPNYRNYTTAMLQFIEQMKDQGNRLYPDESEVVWWENKAYMHRRFDELEVNTPPTILYDLQANGPSPSFEFPFLIKEIHSAGARGIHKIDNDQDLQKILSDPTIRRRNGILIFQKLMDINSDLRVVLVDNEIIFHHWRMNDNNDEWEPTTYKKGKQGDFGNFPEQWREHIIDVFRRIGLVTGAFDLAWEGDDLTKPPLVLEISPSYFPNPEPPASIKKPYGSYKNGLTLTNHWEKHYIKRAYWLKGKVVAAYLSRRNSQADQP